MKVRDEARDRAATTQLPEDWETYRRAKNRCTKSLKEIKDDILRKLSKDVKSSQDVSSLYRKVKSQLVWTSGGPPQALIINGKLNSASKPMADALMNYYTEKIKKLKQNLPERGISPTVYLEERLKRWGDKADRIPEFNLS